MPNIFQRLNEVRKQVAYIQKDKRIQGGGNYLAVTHDAVTGEIREHLVTHGVMIVPTLVASKVVDTGTVTSGGVPIIRYEALYDIAFVNCDEPDDRIIVRIESHALDNGDKAPGKAISYATKYAVLKLFSIETGESEEERIPAKGGNKIVTGPITPTTGAWDNVPKERHEILNRIGSGVIDYFTAGDADGAYAYLYEQKLTNEEFICVWTLIGSKERRALKKMRDEKMQTKEKAEKEQA